jgi:ubiquinone/menaquinone biosynthesis C-methylase UbiE
MGTPWDRAADRYLDEGVPRFVPYQVDLVRELALSAGQRVLVTSAGPGAEALAVARAVGESGEVRATDTTDEMVRFCGEQVKKAGFTCVSCERAAITDVGEGDWNAIICAFGLWQHDDRVAVLRAWAASLAPIGKVGLLTFGPPDDDDAFEQLSRALRELEPGAATQPPRIDAAREAMAQMFEGGGLALVRHTVLRHVVSFKTAEDFTSAIREGRTWRRVWDELGPERIGRVTARFFDKVGGPAAPLTFAPAVTLAIAALPGAEVELATRPSVVAPPLPSVVPADEDSNGDG